MQKFGLFSSIVHRRNADWGLATREGGEKHARSCQKKERNIFLF